MCRKKIFGFFGFEKSGKQILTGLFIAVLMISIFSALFLISELPFAHASSFKFGGTSIGGINDSNGPNMVIVARFQAASTGYITDLEAYVGLVSAGSGLLGVVYNDSLGMPYQFLV